MNESCNRFFTIFGDQFVRLVLGLIFVIAGLGKLFFSPGIDGFTGMLDGLGVPIPGFFAIVIGIVEVLAGLFLALGLFMRPSATALAVIILFAILLYHIPNGWAGPGATRYPLLLLSVLTFYIGFQPKWTVASLLAKPHAHKAKKSKK